MQTSLAKNRARLQDLVSSLRKYKTTAYIADGGILHELVITSDRNGEYIHLYLFANPVIFVYRHVRKDTIESAFEQIKIWLPEATIFVDTIQVFTGMDRADEPVPIEDELFEVTFSVWCESVNEIPPRDLLPEHSFSTDVRQSILKNALSPIFYFYDVPRIITWQALKDSLIQIEAKDFFDFMQHLRSKSNRKKIDNVFKMLRHDRFQLFCELNASGVIGVVKSQKAHRATYACRLTSHGEFSCCNQDLFSCDGMHGALCKHILLLLIGLIKNEQLDPNVAIKWIFASFLERPSSDKDLLADIFIKYNGHHEVDWRPTETIPEDYYDF